MLPTRDPFRPRDTDRLKVKVWKKIFYANGNQNIAEVAILISDEIHFKTMIIKKDTRTLPSDKEISKRI